MRTPLRLAVLFSLASLALTAGDLTITLTSKSKMMGAKSEGKETQYYSTRYMRTNNEATKTDTLVDYQTMVTYTIQHKQKKVQKLSLDDAMAMMDQLNTEMPEGLGGLLGGLMGGGDAGECKVEERGTEVVAGRTCKKYHITVGKLVFDSSNDPSLVPPMPAANFAKMMKSRAAAMGPMGGKSFAKLYEEMGKIKGIALKTAMTGMGEAATEATLVSEGPIAASVFQLPADYKVEDMGKQMRAQD